MKTFVAAALVVWLAIVVSRQSGQKAGALKVAR